MRGGTGDTLVLPLYEWLKAKGVNFQFFHKAVGLHPTADGKSLDSIDIDIQAQLNNPAAGYQPFVMVNTTTGPMEAWPSEPLWDQLVNGDSLKQYNFESYWSFGYPTQRLTLKRGVDFDIAVSGMSIGPLQYYAQDLMTASPTFKAMVDNHATSPTFSIQMWFDKTAADMGTLCGWFIKFTQRH